eukprot:GHVQ01030111.1.p1 GENE.GHVQ01030111.1~~GHVQ01030111.1.p1  ORF type:complete len:465 (+),score=40.91 GHVQ01030111.1:155-1549(+)
MRVYTLHVHVNVGCCVMCIEFILEKMMDCQIPNRGWRLISLLHSLFILSTLYSITVLGMHNPETSLARCDCAPQPNPPCGPNPNPKTLKPLIYYGYNTSKEFLPALLKTIREQEILNIESLLKKHNEQQQQHTGGISGKMLDAMSTAYTWMVSPLVSSLMGIAQKTGLTGLKPFDNPQIEAARQYLSGHDAASDHILMKVMELHDDMIDASIYERFPHLSHLEPRLSQLEPRLSHMDLGDWNKSIVRTPEEIATHDSVNDLTERVLALAEAVTVIEWRYPDLTNAPKAQQQFASCGRQFFQWLESKKPFKLEGAEVTDLKQFLTDASSLCPHTAEESRRYRNACLGRQACHRNACLGRQACHRNAIQTSGDMTCLLPMLASENMARRQDIDSDNATDNRVTSSLVSEYSVMVEGLEKSAPHNYYLLTSLDKLIINLGDETREEMTKGAADCLQLMKSHGLSELN